MEIKKKAKRFRYFAYGSNMVQARLEQRVGRVIKVGTGFLENYEMGMTCSGNNMSFANVNRRIGARTFGAIYKLTRKQLAKLDKFEALYSREYKRINGYLTAVYVALPFFRKEEFRVPPTIDYIRVILTGFKEQNYMQGYHELREKIQRRYNVYLDAYVKY